MQEIRYKLATDLKAAMLSRDEAGIKAVRSLIARIDNAGAIQIKRPEVMPMSGGVAGASNDKNVTEAMRKDLSVEDVKKIIQDEISDLELALKIITEHSRPDTERLTRQIVVLRGYIR